MRRFSPSESLGGRGALPAAPAVPLDPGNGAGGDAEGDNELAQLHSVNFPLENQPHSQIKANPEQIL